jgi:hypothetical protein
LSKVVFADKVDNDVNALAMVVLFQLGAMDEIVCAGINISA